jgi:hypothetical protein
MVDTPILQDVEQPFSLGYPSSLSSKQRREIYEGQVRAFLEASELVEMEEDVLDDILDGFGGFDEEDCDDVADEQCFLSERKLDRDAAGNVELPLPYGFYIFFGPHGITTLSLLDLSMGTHMSRGLSRFTFFSPSRQPGASLDEATNQRDDYSS